MSVQTKSVGQIALGWWSTNISKRETGHARGLSARLRRAGPIEALSETAVHELGQNLSVGPAQADKLVRLVCLLSEVREHDSTPLARRLGGSEPMLSSLRFQRLMRAEELELVSLMRRAIMMSDRRCNIAALASDLWNWDDAARTRWCFHYFGADAPAVDLREKI